MAVHETKLLANILPSRTVEAIKGPRKSALCKDLVTQQRALLQPPAVAIAPRLSVVAVSSPAPVQHPEGAMGSPEQTIPEDYEGRLLAELSEVSNELSMTLPTDIKDIENCVDQWVPPKSAKANKRQGGPNTNGNTAVNKRLKVIRAYKFTQQTWKRDKGRAIRNTFT